MSNDTRKKDPLKLLLESIDNNLRFLAAKKLLEIYGVEHKLNDKDIENVADCFSKLVPSLFVNYFVTKISTDVFRTFDIVYKKTRRIDKYIPRDIVYAIESILHEVKNLAKGDIYSFSYTIEKNPTMQRDFFARLEKCLKRKDKNLLSKINFVMDLESAKTNPDRQMIKIVRNIDKVRGEDEYIRDTDILVKYTQIYNQVIEEIASTIYDNENKIKEVIDKIAYENVYDPKIINDIANELKNEVEQRIDKSSIYNAMKYHEVKETIETYKERRRSKYFRVLFFTLIIVFGLVLLFIVSSSFAISLRDILIPTRIPNALREIFRVLYPQSKAKAIIALILLILGYILIIVAIRNAAINIRDAMRLTDKIRRLKRIKTKLQVDW